MGLISLLVIGSFTTSQYFSLLSYAQTPTHSVDLKSHKIKEDNRLVGQVQNNVGQNVTHVEIIATFYDQNGNQIIKKENLTAENASDSQMIKFPSKGIYQIELNIKGITFPNIVSADETRNGISRGIVVVS